MAFSIISSWELHLILHALLKFPFNILEEKKFNVLSAAGYFSVFFYFNQDDTS